MELLEWLSLEQVAEDELVQAKEEGKDIASFTAEKAELDKIEDLSKRRLHLREFYYRLYNAPIASNYPYKEPVDLESIQKLSDYSSVTEDISERTLPTDLFNAVYGGWLGRAAGCLLGKPVEGMSSAQIQSLLEWKHAFPLDFYIRGKGGVPDGIFQDSEQPKRYDTGVFENVLETGGMLRDDDLDFTILGLVVLESKGYNFTSMDIAAAWLQRLPLLMTYTAERVAYRNIANGLEPPESARSLNPYREWIGAQIRADIWGYICPGNPKLAAELAFRDAQLSHEKNGMYGEMFIAATIAATFVTGTISEAVEHGLRQIPKHSRFADMAARVIEWCKSHQDWRTTFHKIVETYGHYNWFHTLPNAAIVIMALIYSNGDFEEALTISVMAGLDTDCNGATVGSILGVHIGARDLPEKWIQPLNDRLSTLVAGESDSKISDLAKRTLGVIENKK